MFSSGSLSISPSAEPYSIRNRGTVRTAWINVVLLSSRALTLRTLTKSHPQPFIQVTFSSQGFNALSRGDLVTNRNDSSATDGSFPHGYGTYPLPYTLYGLLFVK